ncbi:hypothetical protein V6U81_10610 [Micromonospora sp. CPCC 205711]|uniref:hypothetical protein n=1 Tax=Micromonospora sp. CPCC 205547 TaxID=3122400 RepID=UPI002FF1A396
MFTKGTAPTGADSTRDINPAVDLDQSAKVLLGVPVDRVEAEAEDYRSHADREFDRQMQNVHPAATVKWLEQQRDEYNAWEKKQVTEAVTREVEEHCATADTLREGTHTMLRKLDSLAGEIKARNLTTAQALSKLDAIHQQIAAVRQRRAELAAATRLSELKLAHPHRYMDTTHQAFRKLPRKAVFEGI